METVNTNQVDDNSEVNDVNSEAKESASPKDKVAYKTYDNVMKNLKRKEDELRKIQEERDGLLQNQMEKEGKLTDLVESLKNQVKQKDELLSKKEATFLKKTVLGKIKEKAIMEGCVNPDKLVRLIDASDMEELDIDSNSFDVSDDSVMRLISKAKQDHADIGLFKSSKPAIKNAGTGGGSSSDFTKPISQMTGAELRELYIKQRQGKNA